MGCDIHAHVEIEVAGKWEHYSCLDIDRDYDLFARMANVRNRGSVNPISTPRGLPIDASVISKLESDSDGSDGHSHSWLNLGELKEFDQGLFGWLFGNHLSEFIVPDSVSDVRLVFWYDN